MRQFFSDILALARDRHTPIGIRMLMIAMGLYVILAVPYLIFALFSVSWMLSVGSVVAVAVLFCIAKALED